MESTPTLRFSLQRLFLLTLVSFVAVAAMLGIAASANKANRAAKAQARQAEQAANSKSAINPLVQNGKQQQAPTLAAITATLTDNVTLATKVVPGGTINYTAVITNTAAAGAGNEATNVTYNAPLDANETLVAGSIHASPVAIDNAYTTVGNTLLEAGVAASGNPAVTSAVTLFTNDTISTPPDTIVLASFTAASANGGTVSVNADGSFTYLPPVGFTGNDTFTYTIRNSADASLTNTGTVTVTVGAPRVWYVNNSGANGDGRSTSPFNTLANAAAVDGANDIIYIFTGAGNYTGGITLTNGEQVTGNGVALVVNTFTLRAAGSRPTVVNGAGNGLTLALGNTLSGFNFGNCTGGVAVTGTSVGTLTMNNMLINTNGGALDLTGVATPTVSVVLDSTTSSSGTKNVNLVGLNGTITLGSGALSGASGNAFDVSGAGNAVITYSGTIGNTTARSVNVVNKNGGSVSLSGAVSGSNLGIVLTGNTGSTINFSGGINLSTGANPAFTATGGGTVTATQDNNTIVNTLVTTTGTALNVANTTIGASGVTFRSISSNGGTASGIILNTTGSSGGLTVTGDGINTTKGGNASGGTIANKDDGGTDNSGTVGTGIFLNSTSNVVLRRMQLNDHKNYAIRGLSVTGFTLQYTTINGLNGDTTLGEESNVAFGITNPSGSNGLLGSGLIDNVKISGGVENNMEFYNQSGTLNALTISNSDIKSNTVATGNDGILIESQTSASMTVSVQTCVFDDNKSQAVQFNALDSSTGDITVNSSTLLRTTQGNEGFVFQNASNAHLTAHITNNTSTGIGGVVAFVGNTAGNASATSLLTAVISGNNITHPTTALNSAIIAFLSSTVGQVAPSNIKIDSNTVAENSTGGVSRGIFVDTPDTSTTPSFTATVTSNTVSVGDNVAGLQGIGLQARRGTGCFRVSSNTVTFPNGTPAGVFGIRLRQVSPGVANLEQGAAAGTAAARLAANNPGSTTEVIGTVTVVANGTCLTAPTLPQPEDQTAALSESAVNPPSTALNRQPPQFTGITGSAIGLGSADNSVESATTATSREARIASNPILTRQNEVSSNSSVAATSVQAVSSKVGNSSVMAKATPRFTAAEVARIYRSEAPLSHHAIRSNLKLASQDQNAPASGENVTMNTVPTLPGGSKSITIKYSATVNSPPLARSVQTQGTVTFTGGPGSPLLTTDPETGTAVPTKTNINALMTWNGVTSTDWNTATNWTPPAGGTQYAPGVSNPAVNDVVIPNVGNQPTIGTTDIGIFSLNISNGRTLTITNPRILTIGGSPGGDLTLDGIISGGFLNLGTGTHVITNAGGAGSLSSTNVATVLAGSTTTLSGNLQAGALAINAGASMDITNGTLSLNGSGAALAVPGGATFTTTGSTVIFNGTAAQQAAGIAYNNLTINNTIGTNITGVTLQGNATVNGTLALTSSDLATGAFTLTQPNTTASTGVSDVVGTVKRTGGPFAAITLTFGNPNNQITFSAAGTKPTDMTVVLAKAAPATYTAAVQRNYTMSTTGGSGYTATVRLHYLDSELNGNTPESSLGLRRLRTSDSHWVAAPPPPGVPTRDGANNWIEATGVLAADLTTQWTFSTLAPTASGGTVTGRIVDNNGNPVEGAVVRLSGAQNRKFITDANGVYRFDNVATNGFYTVTPSRANYTFNPAFRSFSQLGESTEAAFGATVATSNLLNPLDTPEYFVRQHYVDFLGREPDEAGFNFWSDQIISCGADTDCVARRRENVSAAYFLSIEFQQTGGLVDGLYRASYGVRPDFAGFMPDTRTIGIGVVVGMDGWEAKLQANKEAFANAFANRAAFHQMYDGMDNSLFVDTLIGHTGVTFTSGERDALVSGLSQGTMTRGDALRSIAENQRFVNAKFNEAFVMMEYFGYLRRDPDAGGFAFWLQKLNDFNGNFEQADMVKAFIVSGEFRDRFPQ